MSKPPKPTATNHLYYGDNLEILKTYIPDESVDLIYLDPPFNSNATYNVLFKAPTGEQSQSQIEAFGDTWHWNASAEHAFDEVMSSGNSEVAEMLRAMRSFLKENDMMAYLAMMAVRLLQLHRVLKPTGSLYLHCDPTASHYLKILLDAVFGPKRYLNEITWKRTTAHNDPHRYGRIQDRLLFYSKSRQRTFHPLGGTYSEEQLARYKYKDAKGHFKAENLTAPHFSLTRTVAWKGVHPGQNRQWRFSILELDRLYDAGEILLRKDGLPRKDGLKEYLHDNEAPAMQDIWIDIQRVGNTAAERLGYPTQKPVALLERIVAASSNEGDLVLDPFCGCGTTVHAAHKLSRRWIGIDITHLAVSLIKRRLSEAFKGIKFDIIGVPQDVGGATTLAEADKYEFQKWALSMIDAAPYKGGKKGGDGGVDGYVYFKPDGKTTEKAIVSVKGGGSLNPAMVKDLMVTVDQEKAKMGIFLTLTSPTKGMVKQAASAGFYKTDYGTFPKIQIVTVAQLFSPSNPIHMPWQDTSVFKKAKKENTEKQNEMDL